MSGQVIWVWQAMVQVALYLFVQLRSQLPTGLKNYDWLIECYNWNTSFSGTAKDCSWKIPWKEEKRKQVKRCWSYRQCLLCTTSWKFTAIAQWWINTFWGKMFPAWRPDTNLCTNSIDLFSTWNLVTNQIDGNTAIWPIRYTKWLCGVFLYLQTMSQSRLIEKIDMLKDAKALIFFSFMIIL